MHTRRFQSNRTELYGRICRAMATAVVLVLTMCLLGGCGFIGSDINTSTEDDKMSDEKQIVVGFSQIGSESVWRTANTESIQNNLTKENGFFLIYSNARQKQENQIKAIRSFISQRVDYIVFSPVTAEGWDTVLQEAKQAGIPVIIVDRSISTSDDSLYATWVGSNSRQEGERAGEWLEGYLKKKHIPDDEDVNIVVLQGTIGSSAQIGRMIGFDSVADRHANWHILEQSSGEFTMAKGKEVMVDMIRRYEDIDVIVSQNDDMTFGAIEAMEEAGMRFGDGNDIAVISFDAVRDALKLVMEGKINVDVECNPEQGPYIADLIQRLDRGEKVPKRNIVDESVFTKENLSEARIAARGY